MTLSEMTLSIMTLMSIEHNETLITTELNKGILRITTLSITPRSIVTLSITTLGIMTLA